MARQERDYVNNALGIIGVAVMEGRGILDDVVGVFDNILFERERRKLHNQYGGDIHEFASNAMLKLEVPNPPRKIHKRRHVPIGEDIATMAVLGAGIITLGGITLAQGIKERIISSHRKANLDHSYTVKKTSWPDLT